MASQLLDQDSGSTISTHGGMGFTEEDAQKPPTVYEAKLTHTHTMIVLHGRGDSGQRFGAFFSLSTINDESLDDILAHTKFIFPSAKLRKSQSASRKYAVKMNQWFDIESLVDTDRGEAIQIEGLRDSSLHIGELIEEELKVIPAENIVLVGLSQGCATALFTLLTYKIPNPEKRDPPPRLGAVVGMSGWLPFRKRTMELLSAIQRDLDGSGSFEDSSTASNSTNAQNSFAPAISTKVISTICSLCSLPFDSTPGPFSASSHPQTPIFMGHGTSDEKVSVELGEKARDTLRALGFEVEWYPYEGFGVCVSHGADFLPVTPVMSCQTFRRVLSSSELFLKSYNDYFIEVWLTPTKCSTGTRSQMRLTT